MIDIVGTLDFICGLKKYLSNIGIFFHKPVKRNRIYSLRSNNPKEIEKFYKFMYGNMRTDFFLPRKKVKFEKNLQTKGIIE